ncbi:hypothetical protein [Clostridium transplantifaecale]|uniref:hypothetical protein n=1 Tax=Clostridium transplantifaecale TaxID=2479838 RepID=UPI000F63BEAD|nr:hypothetical protein [Clostridium transplantifaecale]
MANNADKLLQEIQQAAGCVYLSDLHSVKFMSNADAKKGLLRIPDDRYSLDDWNEAVSYVTGTICYFRTVKEARDRIICIF